MNPCETLLECAESAGRLLLRHFGKVRGIRVKESHGSIVTEADLAADRHLREMLERRHPGHNRLTEEHGFENLGSPFTWVVDPLDGTSNFAAGIPWFGVMLALLDQGQPVAGVMHLPVENLTYLARRGQGATRNGQPVRVSAERDLASVLCGYGMDPTPDFASNRRQALALAHLVRHARNVRATNSLVDFAFTIDGRLGACVNFNTRIWDIAAPLVILEEAGGCLTDHTGAALRLSLDSDACQRSYAVAGGNPLLHARVVELLAEAMGHEKG